MALSTKLQTWQADLLDLSRSNPLLYYRKSGRGSGILMQGITAPQLYSKLLKSGTPSVPLDWVHHVEDPESLERQLVRLRARTNEDLRDRGLQTLYLTFGLLEWLESSASTERILTPLILLPVTLARSDMSGVFTLKRASDDEPEINPVLREKMRNDFGLILPMYEEFLALQDEATEETDRKNAGPQHDLTEILHRLQSNFPIALDSRVLEETHLGRFSFQKLVMYEDLRRNEQRIHSHPILRAIGGDEVSIPQPDRLISASEIDKLVHPERILEILDADSSQQEAILAAKAGASFVLQGPPGTGKSQTIANIIAECLGNGKRVLFVSEKMAALEVVWRRLSDAGLDDFLLNLHDPRQKREIFLKSLAASLQKDGFHSDPKRAWEANSRQLQQDRDELNSYVRELVTPRFALQRSAAEAYAQLARLCNTSPLDFDIEEVEQIDDVQLERMRRLLGELDTHVDILDRFEEHPWRATLLTQHSIAKENDIRAHFTRMRDELDGSDAEGRQLIGCMDPSTSSEPASDSNSPTLTHIRRSVDIADIALTAPIPPLAAWLGVSSAAELKDIAGVAHKKTDTYHKSSAELHQVYQRTLLNEDLKAIERGLTQDCTIAVSSLVPGGRQSAHDVALVKRAELDRVLTEGQAALTGLIAASDAIAKDIGLPAPATEQEVIWLNDLATIVLDTPRPPRAWLDRVSFRQTQLLLLEAEERIRQAKMNRQQLGETYSDALFKQDVMGLEERFRLRYGSPFRIFSGQYHIDARAVRTCVHPEASTSKPSAVQMATDLRTAKQVIENAGWLKERRAAIAESLGLYYNADETDWDTVLDVLKWTRALHESFSRVSSAQPSEDLLRLSTVGSGELRTLRGHVAALASALAKWQEITPRLDALLRIVALVPSATSRNDAAMEALLTGLHATQMGLCSLWDAADVLERHRFSNTSGSEAATWDALCHHTQLATSIVADEMWMSEHKSTLLERFGSTFADFETDWSTLEGALDWAGELASMFTRHEVPEVLAQRICAEVNPGQLEELRRFRDVVRDRLATFDRELTYFETVLPQRTLWLANQTVELVPVSALAEQMRSLLLTLPELERLLTTRLHVEECKAGGLGSLLDAAFAQPTFPRDLVSIFEKRFYSLWLDAVRATSRELARFSGEKHETLITRYRDHDKNHMNLARIQLKTKLYHQRADAVHMAEEDRTSPPGQALLRLQQICTQKRPRGSIRQIVRSVAPILLDLKPCWMMSPLSVSQYVEESGQIFDVVVFDEASQVRPEEAISAILRGRRLIVVGDSKQLPPTQFFTKQHDDNDVDDETDDSILENGRRESILEECRATRMPERSLLWHYRSRHESLIAFSNHHFYGDRLVTFPNPGDSHAAGVRFEYIEDGVYGYKTTQANKPEAQHIVELIAEHLRGRPHLSLGIVALSVAQQEAIEDALELRRKSDSGFRILSDEISDDRPDGFFIKNLESVQGDERDVIIISVGYGKAADGRIRYNFGPVTRSGGARRLNVAVTRAREQTILVSSIRATDLPTTSTSEGARILRAYLDYAERGIGALREMTHESNDLKFDSPFEASVYEALTQKGLKLATQVGCSGYRIDLAVRNPNSPSHFLLGIECDGRSYHSAKTARDRDRLRQAHLEHMGWTILRVWSSDWRRDPDGQVARILQRIHDIHNGNTLPASPSIQYRDAVTSPTPTGGASQDVDNKPVNIRTKKQGDVPTGQSHTLASSSPASTEETRQRLPTRSNASTKTTYAASGTPAHLLHAVASWSGGDFVCENCSYYHPLSQTRFSCGHRNVQQVRAATGRTPCCSTWKRKHRS